MLIIITKWRNNKSNNLYSKLCVFAMKYCSLKTTNTAYIYLCINTTKGISIIKHSIFCNVSVGIKSRYKVYNFEILALGTYFFINSFSLHFIMFFYQNIFVIDVTTEIKSFV